MLTLYSTPLSANGRKVLAAAAALELEARIVEVNVYRGEGHSPAYLAINPSGKIPALTDGDFVLLESNAILIYLAEAHGANGLWSNLPGERSKIAQWLFWEAAHWQPALSAILSGAVGHALFPQRLPKPEAEPDWQAAAVQTLLRQLDGALKATTFLCGAAPTLADFSVGGMTTYFDAGQFPFERHPGIARWYAALSALPAWRATRRAPFA